MKFDLTRPNSGRMLDYWLGGSHNFEIDRQLADQVTGRFPILKQTVPETRHLVKRGIEYFFSNGIRTVLDFGSALPTCDNTHLVAEKLDPNFKVVYSDIDPITVAYGQEILQGNPHVIYVQCDAANPRALFDSPQVHELIGDERRVGIIFLNLAHAMNDDQIRESWRSLYEWAAPGSFLFVSNASENWNTDPNLIAVREVYGRANLTGYFRSPAEIRALANPWRETPEGIVNQPTWHNPQPSVASAQTLGYAAMFSK
jgi:hypothetical protein